MSIRGPVEVGERGLVTVMAHDLDRALRKVIAAGTLRERA